MRNIVLILVAVIMMATPLLAQSWQIDSVAWERTWPDSLVERWPPVNIQTVCVPPWGGMLAGASMITDPHLAGVWILPPDEQNHQNGWIKIPRLPLPMGYNPSTYGFAIDDSGRVYTGTDDGPYWSCDSGYTWQRRNGVSQEDWLHGERPWGRVADIGYAGSGQLWAMDAFEGPAYSSDYGAIWQWVRNGLRVRDPEYDVYNCSLVWISADGRVWTQTDVAAYVLNRNGRDDPEEWEWTEIEVIYNLGQGRNICLPSFGFAPDRTIYLWSGWGYIWRSDNNGENWEQMTEPEDEWPSIWNNTVVPTMVVNDSGLVFIGAEAGGLFVSSDRGDNWLPIGGRDYSRYGPDDEVGAHYWWWHQFVGGTLDATFDLDGHLVIGTWDGVIRSTIPINGRIEPPVAVTESKILPLAFSLSCWPNPFNGILRLRVETAGQPFVLDVFDVQGRLVSNLAQGAGSSQLVWNATALPAGQYLLQLNSPAFSQTFTQPVILAK